MPYQYKREPLSDKETGHLTRNPIKKNLLITGLPGVGKTTLIKKLSEELKHLHPAGFYTAEIREEGVRKGFELISLNGKRGLLSHKDIKSPYRVGNYKVDIKGFEDFLDSIPFLEPRTGLTIIDEIGKMECLSDRFKKVLKEILKSDKLLIATIALKGSGLITEIKKRHDIRLFEITKNNMDIVFSEILNSTYEILEESSNPKFQNPNVK
jgi:nucleoside-triphosphatase